MTNRLISALDNEYVHFIAHPTGRLVNQRNPYSFNLEKVLDEAKKQGKAMEINAYPSRMDFDPSHIRECLKREIRLVINTDAHSIGNLDFMEWGIGQARRGWVETKDVLNAFPLKKFMGTIRM
jgi:DNA polymerase (family 10)